MKNYKTTIHLTKSGGETEIRQAEFGGKSPEESLSNMMEMAFAFGRNTEIENFSIMSVEEIDEFSTVAANT